MFKLTGKKYVLALTALVAAAIAFAGVNLLSSDETSTELGAPGVVAGNFLEGSLTKAITTEDCTLSDGAETTCYRIEVTGAPVDAKIGIEVNKTFMHNCCA
jgi:hypothetical protein